MLSCFRMCVKKYINMMSTDTAAFIFSCIYHSVDHNLGSIRDNSWVNGNSVTGAGNSTGAGTSAPTCRTVAAWAVAGGLKNTKGKLLLSAVPVQKDQFLLHWQKKQN